MHVKRYLWLLEQNEEYIFAFANVLPIFIEEVFADMQDYLL